MSYRNNPIRAISTEQIKRGLVVSAEGGVNDSVLNVYVSNGSGDTVGVAVTNAVRIGDELTIKQWYSGTLSCIAAGAITRGEAVYVTPVGKVTATPTALAIFGYALSDASANNEYVEVMALRQDLDDTP